MVPVCYRIHHYPPLVLHHLILSLDHFRLRNLHLTLSYVLQRALFKNQILILVHVSPKTTILLNIWFKHCVICLLSKFYNIARVNVEHSCSPSSWSILSHLITSRLTLIISITNLSPILVGNLTLKKCFKTQFATFTGRMAQFWLVLMELLSQTGSVAGQGAPSEHISQGRRIGFLIAEQEQIIRLSSWVCGYLFHWQVFGP